MTAQDKTAAPTRAAYPFHFPIQVRWGDFDLFNHLNNVTYFRYFETLIVSYLQDEAGLDWVGDRIAPFVAENSCQYLRPVDQGPATPFGGTILGALRIDHLGTKSVRYGLALFQEGQETPAATGQWVHVFVDKDSGRTAPIPDTIRACFERHKAG